MYTDPLGLEVQLLCRPADIAGGLVNHCWLKTDTVQAGMNAQASCSRAGNDASGYPFVPVVVSDHSCDTATSVTPLPNVDEACESGARHRQTSRPIRSAIQDAVKAGWPDPLINIPSMPYYYWRAVATETFTSIDNLLSKIQSAIRRSNCTP
jgi:hypothetical protein